jgi:hypothetical protein
MLERKRREPKSRTLARGIKQVKAARWRESRVRGIPVTVAAPEFERISGFCPNFRSRFVSGYGLQAYFC